MMEEIFGKTGRRLGAFCMLLMEASVCRAAGGSSTDHA
uniref:Uncharacterized protein n=1 Tax=Anguilla anguilla TaxID=7936 RepID=A0A0E9QYD1_ANGAN